jgi:hypothetical protein
MMKKLLFGILFLIIFAVAANATQFIPLPIDKQIDDADFAVEATLQSRKVYKNLSGAIMSDYFFVVNESFGFPEKELHLDLPGGTLDGVTTMIDGSPNFKENRKIFLFIKKVEGKIYLSNFTLGEYKIVEIDGKTFYQSVVFFNDPKVGIISKDKMVMLMQEKWHYTSTAPFVRKNIVLKATDQPSTVNPSASLRKPAQIKKQDDGVFYVSLIWGGLLILVFGIFIMLRKNK